MPSQDALENPQSALLSDVTLSALQLQQQPFGETAPAAESFFDATCQEQLADIKQALVTGDDLLLILGERGAGKSVLLDQLGLNSGQNIQCFAVKGSPRFSTLNLFAGMLEAFKHQPPEQLKDILDDLIPCLQTMVARDMLSAIILDDADQISESELTQLLSGMLYINGQDETLMRVALAAPSEFEDRIPELLPEGADLPYSSLTIEGMNPERTADYLAFRLYQAGYAGEFPFSGQDLDDIVRQSGGLPAGVNSAAAGILNQIHDPLQHPPFEEFQDAPGPSFLQSRNAKFGLGALAVLLIMLGLLMFMPDVADDAERFSENDTNSGQAAVTNDPGTVSAPPDETSTVSGSPTRTATIGAEPDESSAEERAEDQPALRVVEQRKLVPYTTEAIESLVPEIPLPPRSTSDGNQDSAASGTDSTESAGESTGANVLAEAGAAADAATDSTETALEAAEQSTSDADSMDAPGTETVIEDASPADSVATGNSFPDGATPSVPDTDLLPESADATPAQGTAGSGNSTVSGNATASSQTSPTQTPEVDPELAGILESPTWILVQDADLITVQMSASRDRPSIESFLKRNRDVLPPPNSIYTFQRQGETWYALLHGLFDSFEDAQSAVEQMPESAVTDQPWIRNVGRVQDVLKAQ